MTTLIDSMVERAKADKKTIVLPEGHDDRILAAAEETLKQGIANLVILGDAEEINAKGYNLEGAEIINPATSDKVDEFASLLFELRKKKGMTEEEARELVTKDNIYFATMMVKTGQCDGLVGGASCATVKILSPALKVLKTAPGAPMVSSLFLMEVPNCEFGENGTFVFADCGLNQNPTPDELAAIAISSAESFKMLVGKEPKVAMLSHSSKGSAKHDDVTKVVEATRIAKETAPDLALDGELQLDAAIVPEIGASKAPGSTVAGHANVLVFPDLDAGNIGYKLVQRLAKAEAYGPMCQGIAKPVNDLSRGCSADDIVGVVAITAVQAQNQD